MKVPGTLTLTLAMLVASLPSPGQVPAPDFDIVPLYLAAPSAIGLGFGVAGPPGTPFVIAYAVGNVFYDPAPEIGLLFAGQTDPSGASMTQILVQAPVSVTVPEVQAIAVFLPPAAPPIVTEIVQLSLTAGAVPPPPPPCGPAIGVMTYDPEGCTIVARVKVCPGDLFEVKKNGVTIASGVGPTSGEVVIGLGGQCMAPGDTLTGVVNGDDGDPLLGPIRG